MTDDVSAPGSAVSESLFAAKLTVPEPRRRVVSRLSLIESARKSSCRVVGVTAPAGYGKSTLLAEWASCEDRPVVWVSLDRFDYDPAALLAAMASAFGQISTRTPQLRADVTGLGVSVLGRAVLPRVPFRGPARAHSC